MMPCAKTCNKHKLMKFFTISVELYCSRETPNFIGSYNSHKDLEIEFHTHTPKLSNQNISYIGYSILIGWFSSMNTNIILESVTTEDLSIMKLLLIMIRTKNPRETIHIYLFVIHLYVRKNTIHIALNYIGDDYQ
jgi:hypothetical protein